MKNTETIKKEDIILGVDKDYNMINNTDSPDQFLSVTAFIVNNAAKLLSTYSTHEGEPLSKQDVIDRILKGVTMYTMKESGMSDAQISEVLDEELKTIELN